MPAIAPPDSPLFEPPAAGVDVDEGEEVGDAVDEIVGSVMEATIVGNTTLAQRCCALEL